MFQKQTLKAFSIVAIVLSAIGLLLSILGTFLGEGGGSITFAFILGIVSWSILLWSGIIATQLCSSYQLCGAVQKGRLLCICYRCNLCSFPFRRISFRNNVVNYHLWNVVVIKEQFR